MVGAAFGFCLIQVKSVDFIGVSFAFDRPECIIETGIKAGE